jgi:hypothetical protein
MLLYKNKIGLKLASAEYIRNNAVLSSYRLVKAVRFQSSSGIGPTTSKAYIFLYHKCLVSCSILSSTLRGGVKERY